jgi:hypothetical protein
MAARRKPFQDQEVGEAGLYRRQVRRRAGGDGGHEARGEAAGDLGKEGRPEALAPLEEGLGGGLD